MKRSTAELERNRLLAGVLAGRPPTWGRILLFILSLGVVLLVVGGMLSVPITAVFMVPALRSGQFQLTEEFVLQMLDMMNRSIPGLLVNLLQFVLMAGWTFLWTRVVDGRPPASLGLQAPRPLWQWARGMLVGAGLLVFAVALIPVRGELNLLAVTPEGIGKTVFWLSITLLFFLVQGPAEELVARGYLLQTFSARAGIAAGVLLSSLVFAFQHALNPNLTPLALANLFLYAVFAALYALREESLWGVFGLHSAWNWVQGNIMGLPVSGSGFGQAPLLHLRTAGPGWWTGGAFGPEGGLTVTLSTLLGIIVLLFLVRRRAPAASPHTISAEGGNPGDSDVEP